VQLFRPPVSANVPDGGGTWRLHSTIYRGATYRAYHAPGPDDHAKTHNAKTHDAKTNNAKTHNAKTHDAKPYDGEAYNYK
jgi:hypothetical protein